MPTPSVNDRLQKYARPGNVRELQNVIERAAVLSSGAMITTRHLPQEMHAQGKLDAESAGPALQLTELEPAVEALERHLIQAALEESHDNKSKAAPLLGISERSLWYKIKKYQLDKR